MISYICQAFFAHFIHPLPVILPFTFLIPKKIDAPLQNIYFVRLFQLHAWPLPVPAVLSTYQYHLIKGS